MQQGFAARQLPCGAVGGFIQHAGEIGKAAFAGRAQRVNMGEVVQHLATAQRAELLPRGAGELLGLRVDALPIFGDDFV